MINGPRQPSTSAINDMRSDDAAERTVESDARAPTGVETLQLLEETFSLAKHQMLAGTVRVSTKTDSVQEIADIALDRTVVEITRIPVGQIVEVAPIVRTEGEMTIVPVIEERYVVVKQLFLKEELHIRHRVETEISHVPVVLRRQTAVVDHLDPEGHVSPDSTSQQL